MVYKIKLNRDKCIGCGSCEAVCPKTFRMKEGKANIVRSSIERIECEEEAKNACPVSAISLIK